MDHVTVHLAAFWMAMSTLALLAAIIPRLMFLIEHGKTMSQREEDGGSVLKWDGSLLSAGSYTLARIKAFSVNKSWFLHFYIISVITCLFLIHIVGRESTGGNKVAVLSLFFLHSCRRLYECIYVFKFGSSRMHVAGFIVGVVYYIAVPITLWHEATEGEFPLFERKTAVGLLLFLCGNIAQSYFHWVLSTGRSTSQTAEKRYIFPRGFGFDLVSCPHYTAEITLYAGLCLLIPDSVPMAALLVWVVANLSVVARRSHEWYWATFPEEMKRENERARILPFLY